MVEVLVPFAVIEVGAAVIREVAAEAGPGVNCTVALSVIAAAFPGPGMVAVPVGVEGGRVAGWWVGGLGPCPDVGPPREAPRRGGQGHRGTPGGQVIPAGVLELDRNG